jgi:hypothetical protein
MARPTREVADVFRRYGDAYRQQYALQLSCAQRRVMTAIETCRTAALGGHVEQCDACGHQRSAYNSCRNRHCPKCQSLARAAWVEARLAELLDCEYFHVVFTVPEPIARIATQNKRLLYTLLFRATAETLRTVAADVRHLGARIGVVAVLHTWGQTLRHHPHLHCVIPGGGLSSDGMRWIACRPGFFLPVRVLSRRFRRVFLEALDTAYGAGRLRLRGSLAVLGEHRAWRRARAELGAIEWVVYAKRPFAGPQQVIDYVGRYTHRVAISNDRLLEIDAGQVRFTYTDYRAKVARSRKVMTLAANEFIGRFLLHVLPSGFHRIRYYGFLGARHRRTQLPRCQELLRAGTCLPSRATAPVPTDYRDRMEALTGVSLRTCPACQRGHMIVITLLAPFPPLGPDTS